MSIYTKWYRSFLKNIQLQLFISFISLPFLIGWGLPISLLTPISTLMFGPFLTCFLLVSSLIFFLELFYIPNAPFIWCLEQITTIWLACLNLEQRTWLIGFTQPPIIILLIIPLIALATIHYKKFSAMLPRTGLLALLLVITCAALKLFPYSHKTITTIPCNKGHITLINYHNNLIMIDPAFIAARPNYESFITYTLIPEIIQKTGSLQIDHLIVCKFNKRILDAIQFLATKIFIKNLYIPAWKGKIPSYAWRSYVNLKNTMLEQQANIKSISYKKRIDVDALCTLFIEPDAAKDICYYDATYQSLSVTGTVNNETISV